MKKILFTIALLLIPFIKSFSQNRWMYLTSSDKGEIYLVDTLASETKELKTFDDHENVVIIWTDIYHKTLTKGVSHTREMRYKIAIDTALKQYEIKSYIDYKDGSVIDDNSNDTDGWQDIVPDTMAEDLVKYALSLENNVLKLNLRVNSWYHYNPYDKSTYKYKK